MSTLNTRHSVIKTNIDKAKDFYLDIDGFSVIIEFTKHSQIRGKQRKIHDTTVLTMVKEAFYDIIDLQRNQEFVLDSEEFGVSLVGVVCPVGSDIVIKLITGMDNSNIKNARGTHLIAI